MADLVGRVDHGDRRARELRGALRTGGEVSDLGGTPEQLVARAGQEGVAAGHALQEHESAFEVRQRLAEGQGGLGLAGGVDGRDQGPRAVACGVPVPGHAAGGEGGVARQGGVGLERLGDAAMHAAGLAGQQALGDRLLQQGVPELVAGGVGHGHQHVLLDGGPQRRLEPFPTAVGDGLEECVGDGPADDGAGAQHLPGRGGQGVEPRQQQVTHGGRELGPAAQRQQLFCEEGVPLGAGVDLVEE